VVFLHEKWLELFSPVEYVAKEVKIQQEIVDQMLAKQLEKLEQLRHDESPDKTNSKSLNR
jgi:hypothetical protein